MIYCMLDREMNHVAVLVVVAAGRVPLFRIPRIRPRGQRLKIRLLVIVSIELAQGVILVETSATIMLNVYFPIVKMSFQDDENGSLFLCGDAKESEKTKIKRLHAC